MNLMKLSKFDFEKKSVRIPEWILNVACLGWGIYQQSALFIGIGVLACLVTYFNVLSRLNKWLDNLVKRQ